MIGKCFSVLCIVAFVFGACFGKIDNVSKSILEGADKSVTLCISLIGVMCLWNGILEVLKESGVIKKFAKILRPILKIIFPSSFKNNVATEEITACISAGVLGVSNATTPLAIKAVETMEKGKKEDVATNDMITLCMIGSACFNIIPTTVIALRQSMGAKYTYEIIVPVWICSFACMVIGILLCRLFGKIYGDS